MTSYCFFERTGWRKQPRKDWPARWAAAGRAVNWEGVFFKRDKGGNVTADMIAERRSPIWKALAKGMGGFRDAIGNGKPPFAYGSGMGWAFKPLNGADARKAESLETLKQRLAKQEIEKLVSNLAKYMGRTINIELKL